MIDIYNATCKNVRELKKNARILKRLINSCIKQKRNEDISVLTNAYALIYSSFAEVSFIKLIHTPYGFSEDYIKQIQSKHNLEGKWDKCFELAFLQTYNANNLGEIANKKQQLKRILHEYIFAPSQIRNKIAHGQWSVCLNNDCSSINTTATNIIKSLDYVKIDILFKIYQLFLQCVEDLIESPYKAHYRDFYNKLTALEQYLIKTSNYTLESKKIILNRKQQEFNSKTL